MPVLTPGLALGPEDMGPNRLSPCRAGLATLKTPACGPGSSAAVGARQAGGGAQRLQRCALTAITGSAGHCEVWGGLPERDGESKGPAQGTGCSLRPEGPWQLWPGEGRA